MYKLTSSSWNSPVLTIGFLETTTFCWTTICFCSLTRSREIIPFLWFFQKVAQLWFTTGRSPLGVIHRSFHSFHSPRDPIGFGQALGQAVSIPLQCLCLAVFDAVLVHMLKVWIGWGFRVDWLMVTIVSHMFLKIWRPYLPNTLGWVLGVLGMW